MTMKAGFWHDIARQVETEFKSRRAWNMMLEQIWFGRVGQIVAAAAFVVVIAWCAFWGGGYYRSLQELEINIGDRSYQTCLAEARTAAELSGAANMIEEPCQRQQAMVQAKVVSMFVEFAWRQLLADFLEATIIWFSLCVIAATIRFFVREAQVVLLPL